MLAPCRIGSTAHRAGLSDARRVECSASAQAAVEHRRRAADTRHRRASASRARSAEPRGARTSARRSRPLGRADVSTLARSRAARQERSPRARRRALRAPGSTARAVDAAGRNARADARRAVRRSSVARPVPAITVHRIGHRSPPTVARHEHSTPPFTDEHEELRSRRGFIERELRPTRSSGRRSAGSPTRSSPSSPRRACSGLKYPERVRRAGRRLPARGGARARSWRASARAAPRRGSARTSTSPRRRSGSSAPRSRSSATSCRRSAASRSARSASPSPAPARTSPRCARAPSASTAAGWSTARRPTSPTACAPHFIVTAVKTTAGGRPPRHLVPDRRPRRGRRVLGKLEKLGWHASDTATIAFEDVFVPEENLLGELHEGFKLIMANFQWERLAMALGAVGAMQLAWERTAEFARERNAFGRPLSGHQAIRHKLADLATSRLHLPLRHLRRAAPLRRRRGAAARRSRWPSCSPSAPPSS